MIRSIGYLLREGLRNLWCNRLMTAASVSVMVVCMLLSGGSVLISMNVQSMLKQLEGNNLIMAYLDDDVSTLEAVKIGNDINELGNIESLELVTNEEALDSLLENVEGAEAILEELKQDNPLPHAYRITVSDLEKYELTRSRVAKLDGVQSVRSETDVSEKLIAFEDSVSGVLLWIILLLVFVSLFIITSTIRMTLFSRRKEIGIMKSVGATDGFIRIPFIVEGILIGIFSGIIAMLLLKYGYSSFKLGDNSLMGYEMVKLSTYESCFLGTFIIGGAMLGALGGILSIRRYLKNEGGDLYE